MRAGGWENVCVLILAQRFPATLTRVSSFISPTYRGYVAGLFGDLAADGNPSRLELDRTDAAKTMQWNSSETEIRLENESIRTRSHRYRGINNARGCA